MFSEVNDLNSSVIKDLIARYSLSKSDNEKKLLKKEITSLCLPFVKKIARGLARRNTDPIEDLIQVGCVGLLKAIEQYSSKHKTTFKTYATYFITGEIRHYLRDKVSMIRAPRELQELSYRINQLIRTLTLELDREPTDYEISEHLSISVEKINEIVQIDRRKNLVSLDQAQANQDDASLIDKLVDNKYLESEKNKEENGILIEAINSLEPQLAEVIRMSFFQDMTQQEISQEVGVSQMQISRRLKKALEELSAIMIQKREEND
ncbi:MAG: sigma-70 family RNA polymerase sigma factor [Candidatus Gastranaerophilales bacterium]|nr:sigma-70 family RNA polymerase sigma factor [Candidatus Gastranaerophilales bacterium]